MNKRNIITISKFFCIVLMCIIGLLKFSVPTYASTSYTYDFSFDNTEGVEFWIDTWQVYITVEPGTVVTVNVHDTHTVLENTLFIWQNDDGLLINPDVDFGINSYTFPEIQEGGYLVAQCPVWEHYGNGIAPKEIGYVNFYVTTYSSIVSADKLKDLSVSGENYDVVMKDYVWHVNAQGCDVGDADLDLSVDIDTGVIEQSVVNKYFYEYDIMELSLAHDGDIPLSEAVLELDAGVERAGKYGALYYYVDDGFTYMTSALVDENGKLNLDFQHASDYIVVFSDVEGQVEFVDGTSIQNESDDTVSDDSLLEGEKQQETDNGMNPFVVPIVVVLIIVVIAIVLLTTRKNNKGANK